jgi:inosine/xanthosine triphosphatase
MTPTTIAIASHNPVKLQAVGSAFRRAFPGHELSLAAVSVSPGVSSQPLSDEEPLRGALTRAQAAALLRPPSDFCVGIEGGIQQRPEGMVAFAWAVVLSAGRVGRGRTATFFLPEAVAALIRQGKELGEADDLVFGRSNSKQQEGAVGILTRGVVDRAHLYEQAVILALIPHANPNLFPAIEPDLSNGGI